MMKTHAPGPTTATRFGFLLRCFLSGVAMLALALDLPRRAAAQVDTAAARDARQAIQEIKGRYQQAYNWSQWSGGIGLADVEHELRVGDRAESGPLQAAVSFLKEAGYDKLEVSAFKRLAAALETRVAELEPIPPQQWADACRQAAQADAQLSTERWRTAWQTARSRLLDLDNRLPEIRRPGTSWYRFFAWPEPRALFSTTPPPDLETLDRQEAIWSNALAVWNGPVMVEASLAMRTFIRLERARQQNESAEQRADAWNELASLVKQTRDLEQLDFDKIAAAVDRRERLGQASAVTASIRRTLSRPNLVVQVRPAWLQSELASKIDEQFTFNDVFAGARSRGNGRLVGDAQLEVLPSKSTGRWLLKFAGTTTSASNATSRGVRVQSSATTQVRGSKEFSIDSQGLMPEPAAATAESDVVYDNINTGGYGSEALRQVYGRRGRAERDAETSTRGWIVRRLDSEGGALAQRFNQLYQSRLRDPILRQGRLGPEVRVRTSKDNLDWECRVPSRNSFAATAPAPNFAAKADVVMKAAASALTVRATTALDGRLMTGRELAEQIGEIFGKSTEAPPNDQDFTVKFADHACDVDIQGGEILVRFHIESFDSKDVTYPAMTVDTRYLPELRSGDLAFVRQGRVSVAPIGEGLSGRQQTLRIVVQRKLGAVLAGELIWSRPQRLLTGEANAKFKFTQVSAEGGWLQLALVAD